MSTVTDEDVIGASAYPFGDEVLVELTVRDEDGYLAVHSYQFERTEQGLRPKEPVAPDHRDAVVEALAENDYVLEGGSPAPGDDSG